MKFNLNKQEYRVIWKHERPVIPKDVTEELKELIEFPLEELFPGRLVLIPKTQSYGRTDCFIKQEDHVLFEGHCRCSENDTWTKRVGRELSLKRALENSDFSKSDRYKIWEEFKKQTSYK